MSWWCFSVYLEECCDVVNWLYFVKNVIFGTIYSISWLLLINYDDEELCWWIFTCNWLRIDGVCMYWNVLMLIVDDLLLNICIDWVICSWFHDVSCRIVYPYWRQPYFISIFATINIVYSYWRRLWYRCI